MLYNNFCQHKQNEYEKINYYVNEQFIKGTAQKYSNVCSRCGCQPCRCALYSSAMIEYSNYYYCPYCGRSLLQSGGCQYCSYISKPTSSDCSYYNYSYGRPAVNQCSDHIYFYSQSVEYPYFTNVCSRCGKPYNSSSRPRPNLGEPCGCYPKQPVDFNLYCSCNCNVRY